MKLNIPEEYQEPFRRLMRSSSLEIRKSAKVQKTTVMYLALGSEALARRYIELSQMSFPDGSELFDYAPVVEPETDTANPPSDESDESDENEERDESDESE